MKRLVLFLLLASNFGLCQSSGTPGVIQPGTCAAGNAIKSISYGLAPTCTAVGTGTVTNTAGSLTLGKLLTGNGGSDITVGDLSGDCTTSGSTAITCTKTNGIAISTVTNSAGNNVVPKSSGTNLIASSVSDNGTLVTTAEEIDSGLAGTANGVIGLNGTTSGKATLTAPAVAGTSTNPIVVSNVLSLPNGTSSSNAIQVGAAGYGLYFGPGVGATISANASDSTGFAANETRMLSTGRFTWCPSTTMNCTIDTGLSRDSAGVVDVGSGAQGSFSGTLKFTTLNLQGTGTVNALATQANCAVNSASPAACGSAASGAFVVPTTTTTYTVNTTVITTVSRVMLQPRTYAGDLPSAPTCVAPASGAVTVSAVSAGTSFSFALPSTAGQTCWNYWVVD